MVKGEQGNLPKEKAVIYRRGEELVLRLTGRKNKITESSLVRRCWCGTSRLTCPVHVVGYLVDKKSVGEKLFPRITAANALKQLRAMLADLQVQDAGMHRTHDIRRGHAKDLQQSGTGLRLIVPELQCFCACLGAHLRDILKAGEWRSPAFLDYLDMEELERDVVIESHIAESNSETEDEAGYDSPSSSGSS